AEVDAKRKADEDSARAHAAAARLAAEAAAIRNAEDETARQRAEAARLAAQGPIKTEDQVKPATDASPPVPAASGQVSGSTSSPGSERAPELEANLASCMKEFSEIPMAQSIRFRSNSSELSGRHSELLDSIAAVAKRCDAMSLVIGGHTDWSGNELSNQSLSDERAEAVRAALVERGVVSKRLETMSFGARQPADGVYRGRAVAADRRVEVKAREYIAVPAAP
ncbi:MAG: OmpA family protein, partial [Hyphomicrobium sp.]